MREELFPFWEGKSLDEVCEDQYRCLLYTSSNVAASVCVIVRGCVPLGRYAVLSKQASEGELHERDQVPALWPDV